MKRGDIIELNDERFDVVNFNSETHVVSYIDKRGQIDVAFSYDVSAHWSKTIPGLEKVSTRQELMAAWATAHDLMIENGLLPEDLAGLDSEMHHYARALYLSSAGDVVESFHLVVIGNLLKAIHEHIDKQQRQLVCRPK